MNLIAIVCFLFNMIVIKCEGSNDPFETTPCKQIPSVNAPVEPYDFYRDHVILKVPLLLKNSGNDLFHLDFFDSDVAAKFPHIFTTYLEVKNQDGAPSGNLSLYQFLKIYEQENVSIDIPMPTVMKSQTYLPLPLLCNHIIEGMRRTRFVMHSGEWQEDFGDDGHNVLICQLNGGSVYHLSNSSASERKEVNTAKKLGLESAARCFSTTLNQGDCIFIPSEWPYKRNTTGRSLNINIYWELNKGNILEAECGQPPRTDLTMISFPEDPQMDILSVVEFEEIHHFIQEYYLNSVSMDMNHFLKEVSMDNNFDGIPVWDEECGDIAKELFQQMDYNGDGLLSAEDFRVINKQELQELVGKIDDRLADFEDISEDAKAERKGSLLDEAKKATNSVDEIKKLIEDGFKEIFSDVETSDTKMEHTLEEKERESDEIRRMGNLVRDSVAQKSQFENPKEEL